MSKQLTKSSLDDLIAKLKSQGLTISDETEAKSILSTFGYSNLIKSYRDPYVVSTNTGKKYRTGVTFDQIYSLYFLDKNLRNAVMASMLDLEERIKMAAADVLADSFGVDQNAYLNYRNFQNKKKRLKRFSLKGILEKLQSTLETDKEPIHHYLTQYGTVPPWILLKSVYFSTVVNFIDQFKTREKDKLVRLLYPDSMVNTYSPEVLRNLMMDSLYTCLDYRNMAAHGGRIFSHNTDTNIRFASIISVSAKGFSQLLWVLSFLQYTPPHDHLCNILRLELSRHCSSFRQDVTYLGQILNIDVTFCDTVYITKSSKKYHLSRYCSGLKNATEIELTDAINQGYIACKRCKDF